MKNLYDSLLRTIVAMVFFESAAYPFIKLGNPSLQARLLDILFFVIPVFVSQLLYSAVITKRQRK
jgi:hypothetical protein